MEQDALHNKNYFDLSLLSFRDLFDTTYLWEVIPHIETYINSLFLSGKLQPNYKRAKNVYIGKDVEIHDTAEIRGPAIIGDGSVVEHGALLRNACLIGKNVKVGHAVEIKNSVILDNAAVAHLGYVGDSIIGDHVNISGGAIIANYRLDKKNIKIKTLNGVIETGLKKFGAIIGDDSVIGVNAVINPGTMIGKNSLVYPLTSVSGLHAPQSIIKG